MQPNNRQNTVTCSQPLQQMQGLIVWSQFLLFADTVDETVRISGQACRRSDRTSSGGDQAQAASPEGTADGSSSDW